MVTLRVLLADDHAVVREGLKALINAEDGLEVVGEAADGLEAVAMADALDPDIAVVDVSMPGLTGDKVASRLREHHPNRKVIALTVHEDRGYLRQLLAAGAAGYVLKRAASSELIQAIRAVAGGGTYVDPALAGSIVDTFVRPVGASAAAQADLSEREAEVVRLIARGYSNKEIAARLGLSVKTIETYKTRSMEKLRTRSRVELVQYAARRGWLMGE
jgi:DNA-binding NarL/FixJ family response regulator